MSVSEAIITTPLDLLRVARKTFENISHLQNNVDPNDQRVIVGKLRRAISAARRAQTEPAPETKALQAAFLEKYKATVAKDRTVTYTIPQGSSVTDLLRDAQTVSFALRGVVAVYPPRLAAWMQNPLFTEKMSSDTTRIVDPAVKGSQWKTREKQKDFLASQGKEMAHEWELAAAHAIYSVFTNRKRADLFGGNIIRIVDGDNDIKLYYGNGGLSEMDQNEYVANCEYQNVRTATAKRV